MGLERGIPFIEMLKFQKKNPNLHLYEYLMPGTFSYYVFAPSIKLAKKQIDLDFGLSIDDIHLKDEEVTKIF